MLNMGDILETITMIEQDHLDIRTVTMGISLLSCMDSDIDRACDKVYEKITRCADRLVPVCEAIEKEYGIPIINKRIAVTPVAMLAAACPGASPVKFALTLERAANAVGVNFIGGYSALVQKGFAAGDRELIESIPEALARHRARLLLGRTSAPPRPALIWTRWPPWAASSGKRPSVTGRAQLHRRGEARGLLQRAGGQSLYGRRISRRRGTGLRHQRGRIRSRA